MSELMVNRVAESGLVTFDLETFYPEQEVTVFDLKDFLFMGLILKEKDFRESLKGINWKVYAGKLVAVTCSADAIIPMWAYMLVAACLQPVAFEVFFGNRQEAIEEHIIRTLQSIDLKSYQDQRIVIKGCGEKKIGEKVYLEISMLLRPVAKSLMYGEPCSTVPVFKKAAGN